MIKKTDLVIYKTLDWGEGEVRYDKRDLITHIDNLEDSDLI